VILIKYFQYQIKGIEGLCNQLMAIFRTLGEALFYSTQEPSEPVEIILNDVQTRTSVDFDSEPYFSKINIDSFVDVNELTALMANKNISVRRLQDINHEVQIQVTYCTRFPHRNMLPNECQDVGEFLAKSFPFSKHTLKIASCIIGLMSHYPRWAVIHLRIEGDLLVFPSIRDAGLEAVEVEQLQKTINIISSTPNLSAVYLATGIQEEKFENVVNILNDKFPHITVTRKNNILKHYPKIKEELESLSLEEQALIDWLVCIGSPFFAGNHASSFAYLAAYMRHYRGWDKETTNLWPEYQPLWDAWFPRV
jgi:hypothetical protein